MASGVPSIPGRTRSPVELWRAIQDLQRRIGTGGASILVSGGGGGGSSGGGTAVTSTYSSVLKPWNVTAPDTVTAGETWCVSEVNLEPYGELTLDGELVLLGG